MPENDSTSTPLDSEASDGSVGSGNYIVQQGDCLSSIGNKFGFSWQTLWNLPANAELKSNRKDPNVLLPGDRITIPDMELRQQSADADKQHCYVKLGEPAKLRMRFLEDGEPRSGEKYTLIIDGQVRFGTLDNNGQMVESIPAGTESVRLSIDNEDPVTLKLGTVDPITEISGVQGRLNNLGYYVGDVDNIVGPRTREGLRRFQQACRLPVTGTPDHATRDKLVNLHGC